jgi:hypothetical protein
LSGNCKQEIGKKEFGVGSKKRAWFEKYGRSRKETRLKNFEVRRGFLMDHSASEIPSDPPLIKGSCEKIQI